MFEGGENGKHLAARRSIGRSIVCLALLLASGCRSEYTISDICECPEPNSDDPANGDDGDDHESFDFEIKDLTATASDGSPTIHELEDITFAWTVEYHWDPCTKITHVHDSGGTTAHRDDSTAGTSGIVAMRYALTDSLTSDVLWSGVLHSDFRMGTVSGFSVEYDGVEVPGTDPSEERWLLFEVVVDASPEQECPDDLTNVAIIQDVVVSNCPCENGDDINDLYPTDLTWDPTSNTLTWKNNYEWGRCGREEDELTEVAIDFTETVTVWTFDGTVQYSEARAAIIAVPLNDWREVNRAPDTSGWDPPPYIMQVELSDLAPGIDCDATESKTRQIIVK